MKYYKVKKDFRQFSIRGVHEFVEGELLTEKEFLYLEKTLGVHLRPERFESTEISKNKTAWVFGARKEVEVPDAR